MASPDGIKMAAPSEDEFDRWLSEKLQKINEDVDLEVFVTYIRGVLETDTDDEDKDESITGILGEITVIMCSCDMTCETESLFINDTETDRTQ